MTRSYAYPRLSSLALAVLVGLVIPASIHASSSAEQLRQSGESLGFFFPGAAAAALHLHPHPPHRRHARNNSLRRRAEPTEGTFCDGGRGAPPRFLSESRADDGSSGVRGGEYSRSRAPSPRARAVAAAPLGTTTTPGGGTRAQRRPRRSLRPLGMKPEGEEDDDDGGGGGDGDNLQRQQEQEAKADRRDLLRIDDARLLAFDLLAILVACELLGLFDAVGRGGLAGFLNPISPGRDFDNLPLLVRRDSALSMCWIAACLRRGGYLFPTADGGNDDDDKDDAVQSALASLPEFFLLLAVGAALAGEMGIVFVSGAPPGGGFGGVGPPRTYEALPARTLEVLREGAVSFAAVAAFRSLYSRAFGGY